MSASVGAAPAPRVATCSCGQLRATVSGEPVRNSICHCLACQRRTGGPFSAQARFNKADVTVTGPSTSYTRTGDAGSRSQFHFCPQCGVTVYFHLEVDDGTIAIPVGTFADPAFPPPRVSVYESRKHAWVVVPADAAHYD